MNQKYGQYKKNSITTASSGRVLLMLYSAAIKNVRKARKAMEEKNIPEKCKYILKTQDIIHELANSLDFTKGGELVERLEGLYNFIGMQLTEAHLKNEVEPLDVIEKILLTLNEGWVEAVKHIEGVKKSENPANESQISNG